MPLNVLKIIHRHGKQFIPDLRVTGLPDIFRGKPVISSGISLAEQDRMAEFCPLGAIYPDPCRIDLGKCVFCKECQFAFPGKIVFTNDHKIATNTRESLIITEGETHSLKPDEQKIRKEIRSFFGHALKLRQVSAGGDNSAEMELNAAGNVNFDMGRFGIEFVASPRHADGIVITGPITASMAEALKICYDAIPVPKIIILAGTDAISGGIFSDSPAVQREFLENYIIDLYVPGNPPHPLTFINGLLDLTGRN